MRVWGEDGRNGAFREMAHLFSSSTERTTFPSLSYEMVPAPSHFSQSLCAGRIGQAAAEERDLLCSCFPWNQQKIARNAPASDGGCTRRTRLCFLCTLGTLSRENHGGGLPESV